VLNRPSVNKIGMAALYALAAWTALAYSLHILAGGGAAHAWREFVLIALLPAVGIIPTYFLIRYVVGDDQSKNTRHPFSSRSLTEVHVHSGQLKCNRFHRRELVRTTQDDICHRMSEVFQRLL